MIKIYPQIEYKFVCSVCREPNMINKGFFVTGMHSLAETSCRKCKRKFFADLPVGQALFTPLMLNTQNREVYGDEIHDWFADSLKYGFSYKNHSKINIKKKVYKKSKNPVLINCLDYRYGHCLLKLLNTQRYLKKGVDCWVIVPSQISHLVPEGVASVWEVELPIEKLNGWFLHLNKEIQSEMKRKDSVYLARLQSHPHRKSFDIRNFIKMSVYGRTLPKPVVVFSYREDRTWGKSINDQKKKINSLFKRLKKKYSNLSFILYGVGNFSAKFHKEILDFRFKEFSEEMEKEALSALSQAECVIGVHGSNMLLPSALSETVIELLSPTRWGNVLQDYLPPKDKMSSTESLFRMRILYGNNKLSNISPELVANLSDHLISYRKVFLSTMDK